MVRLVMGRREGDSYRTSDRQLKCCTIAVRMTELSVCADTPLRW